MDHPYNPANVERFSGYADLYDDYRPQPPNTLIDILLQYIGRDRADKVVDLGSGTGLFTRVWVGRTKEVIGVEPNSDMRSVALSTSESYEKGTNIRYVDGHSADTTLPENTADIVCCSQSFHWMEPNSTLSEVNRILKTGGLFATIDCDWPPVINPQAEQEYRNTIAKINSLEHNRNRPQPIQRWSKDKHMGNIQACGYFKYVREICMHRTETGTADRLVGLLLSQGCVESLLKAGITEKDLGIMEFRSKCEEILGDSSKPWYFSYRVRIGVK